MLLLDPVQRMWQFLRNGRALEPSVPDVDLIATSSLKSSMSSLLAGHIGFADGDEAEPAGAGFAVSPPAHTVEPGTADAHFHAMSRIDRSLEPAIGSVAELEPLDTLQRRGNEARARASWSEAASLYEAMCLRQPEEAAHAIACAEANRNAGDGVKADLVLQRFHRENGASVLIAMSYALNAQVEQDWQNAFQRWHEVRVAFPDIAAAWAAEIAMLMAQGLVDQALDVAQDGLLELPGDMQILLQCAGVRMAQQDWFSAVDHISEIETQAPLHADIASHLVTIRSQLAAHIGIMPTAAVTERAIRAEESHDWGTAVAAWRVIYERSPDDAWAVRGLGQALRKHGAFEEADRILHDGIETVERDENPLDTQAGFPGVSPRLTKNATGR